MKDKKERNPRNWRAFVMKTHIKQPMLQRMEPADNTYAERLRKEIAMNPSYAVYKYILPENRGKDVWKDL